MSLIPIPRLSDRSSEDIEFHNLLLKSKAFKTFEQTICFLIDTFPDDNYKPLDIKNQLAYKLWQYASEKCAFEYYQLLNFPTIYIAKNLLYKFRSICSQSFIDNTIKAEIKKYSINERKPEKLKSIERMYYNKYFKSYMDYDEFCQLYNIKNTTDISGLRKPLLNWKYGYDRCSKNLKKFIFGADEPSYILPHNSNFNVEQLKVFLEAL